MERCPWPMDDLYLNYHDHEWGTPVTDDVKQFEFLVLESAQAGLSWSTILKKRENYRAAYDGFDPVKVAAYGPEKVEELMANAGIVRNRRKIDASVNNAQRFLEVAAEFGSFTRYIWSFTGFRPVLNKWKRIQEIPAKTELSDRISGDLAARGFRFLGSIIIYSHLQAVGIVNDHIESCFRYWEIRALYDNLEIPGEETIGRQ